MRRLPIDFLTGITCLAAAGSAQARTLLVPRDHPTIQQAVYSASPGDEVLVSPGRHCGATLDRPIAVRAAGEAVIVGCPTGPAVLGELRVGFLLPGRPDRQGDRSGGGLRQLRIQGFTFDGAGVSNNNLGPLAFGIHARFAHEVQIIGNRFQGTVQAITNTAGDGWTIRGNRIEELTLFDCRPRCGGGDGIVVQAADGLTANEAAPGGAQNPHNRPERTLIIGNQVRGRAPPGFTRFGMAGIVLMGADATFIWANRLAVAPGPGAGADHPLAAGVLFTDQCCARPQPLSEAARLSAVLFNDGSESEYAVLLEGADADSLSLVMAANAGRIQIGDPDADPDPDSR